MKNSNFGYDCRNNIANYLFAPINDELNEVSYLKKYHNPFNQEISEAVGCDLLEVDIESKS